MNEAAHWCTDATILTGVNWKRLREELATCRVTARLNQTQLARQIGIAKSTVNRIENVSGDPDHVPDLDTIERWVVATGQTLGSFFTLIDRSANPPLKSGAAPADNASAILEPGAGELIHGPRRTLDEPSAADILRALREAGEILFNAGLARPREQDPVSRPGPPGRGAARGKAHR